MTFLSPQNLTVVTAISNPVRYKSRIRLYEDFEQRMLAAGVKLVVVECTYGDHDPQLKANPQVRNVKVRTSGHHKLWHKECLLNLGIAAAADAKYIATIDADVHFRDPDWALKTLDMLQ